MSIKSIEQKFTSANSVPVERAMVTRDEWEAVKQVADDLAEVGEFCYSAYHLDGHIPDHAIKSLREALTNYRSAKQ